MRYGDRCPKCNQNTLNIALVDLVTTWESNGSELIETTWHKTCFLAAQQNRPENSEPVAPLVGQAWPLPQ